MACAYVPEMGVVKMRPLPHGVGLRNFLLVFLETLYYIVVKELNCLSGVPGRANFVQKCPGL